jgi:hypothetical protein
MTSTTFNPAIRRFAWKEYRTLRGLWLAVAALTIGEQWLSRLLSMAGPDLPAWLFASALFASVLYSVGAASILFSVEHEDQTYDFLTGLPTTWLPVFTGKLLIATTSALALAALLLLTGCAIGGENWPNSLVAQRLLALFGLGIFEAIAWGTLFSLCVKRPLVAALLALLVGPISIQFLVSYVIQRPSAAADPAAYDLAVPHRLALMAVVALASTILARRWLTTPVARRRPAARALNWRSALDRLKRADRSFASSVVIARSAIQRRCRRRVLSRLLWQSWRDSWRMLPLPLVGAAVVFLGLAIISGSQHELIQSAVAPVATLSIPALYGALVFGADQRRRNYRFLAEHAASPRYVWLARHTVWLATLLILVLISAFILLFLSGRAQLQHTIQIMESNSWRSYSPQDWKSELQKGLWLQNIILPVIYSAASTLLLAYAVGQTLSMLVRSEIMAAFLTSIAVVFVCIWTTLVYAWELNGLLFILPLAIGLLAATWLRAPDWLAERNAWRAWLKPALAVAVPLVLILLYLPTARLAQLPSPIAPSLTEQGKLAIDGLPANQQAMFHAIADSVFDPALSSAGDTPAARETAQMYLHAASILEDWDDPLQPWLKYQVLDATTTPYPFNIKIDDIPESELLDFKNALSKHREQKAAAESDALEAFAAASQRPSCRLQFDPINLPLQSTFPNGQAMEQIRKAWDPQYRRLMDLTTLAANSSLTGDEAFAMYLAGLRACVHIRSGQPVPVAAQLLDMETAFLDRIAEWATQDEVTNEQRRDAIKQLKSYFAELPDPAESIVPDRNLVREVILGNVFPLVVALSPRPIAPMTVYLLNKLPWERERALREVDLLASQDMQTISKLNNFLGARTRDAVLRFAGEDPVHPNWSIESYRDEMQKAILRQYSSETSWVGNPFVPSLGYQEFRMRVPLSELQAAMVHIEVYRRATLLRIALAMYHHDHSTYPHTLEELVPDYLLALPVDPYSGVDFEYRPDGVDAPLTEASRNGADVPPDTPFLWSVGAWNATELVRFNQTLLMPPDDHEDAKSVQFPVYRIGQSGQPWYSGHITDCVFSLPK